MGKLSDAARALKREVGVYRLVLRDKRTPLAAKLLLGLAVGYLVMPFDLIPDFVPVLGQLDDIVLVAVCFKLAVRMIPKDVVADARQKTGKDKA